jgi:DNA (cytosine-5)-methyltransferase 1
LNYIELFAGCGGLSLGLESIDDSRMIMANELSPMPAQTFAYNFFNEDLEIKGFKTKRIKWLSSQHSVENLKQRLREDPRTYPELNGDNHETDIVDEDLDGKLIVGNIIHLNQFLANNPNIAEQLSNAYGHGTLDFVSGGPPCQSFSMAGLRNRDCDKNLLPWEFAQFVNQVQPRFAILENVTGILRAFEQDGERYYAWIEVSKAFSEIGYVPLCLHVNARFAGVPQNRPRFIMIGVRHDIYETLTPTFNNPEIQLFSSSIAFYNSVQNGNNPGIELLQYHDVVNEDDLELFTNSFLAPVVSAPVEQITVEEAIDDLRFNGVQVAPSEHIINTANSLAHGNMVARNDLNNHEERANGDLVQRRFRLYQIMQQVGNGLAKEVRSVLKGSADNISGDAWEAFGDYDYLIEDGTYIKFNTKNEFLEFLFRHPTKKQTQKALDANSPAPAALSIPDDACHYHHDELRTLTVREMARIQSFPDNFVFRSKVTTGGQQRKFEVPQYTQVGNAVPPLLGRALGLSIKNLLNRL